ncbi:hypothetical protein BMF94_5721 [Rhodotorula taiwanensis]|uniref:J domain-containing protein n=1 Tax=Rhodotorula taiwanensis TaxID=741276 RepID=A0A2S5B3Q3_9BASI|nr:hypothetical protein BMF94_5721 [Rhodotorula taiwanensis]
MASFPDYYAILGESRALLSSTSACTRPRLECNVIPFRRRLAIHNALNLQHEQSHMAIKLAPLRARYDDLIPVLDGGAVAGREDCGSRRTISRGSGPTRRNSRINDTASFDQIKTAYKRKSLQCHPDRVPSGTANDARRRAATVKFQAVADAYFELSDPSRRRAYDQLRKANQTRWTDSSDESANFWNYFGGGAGRQQEEDDAAEPEDFERPDPEHVFGNVFEELLRPEVHRILPIWTWGGAASGAVLGFITANLPGAAFGAFAGSKLGAIRDAKGKSVASVFSSLPQTEKAGILAALAKQVFGMSGLPGSSAAR